MKKIIFSLTIFIYSMSLFAQTVYTDVLIIGGGASGTMAGIQAARMGVAVIIIEETPWIGGMLTSAGVSAIDGNYNLHSGLWEEFRQELYSYYGSKEKLKTGWVSNVLFEPNVAQQLLTKMATKEKQLSIHRQSSLHSIEQIPNGWTAVVKKASSVISFEAKIVIDATELGDIAKMVGIPYDIGMDSKYNTGEQIAPKKANNIVQDLTYVAILKDFGKDADKTIVRPENYDPTSFYCTCAGKCNPDSIERTLWPCNKMITYGKLPNDYYMINWPIYGNDFYLNIIEASTEERKQKLEKAKNFTLQYIHYLQTELGFKNLGLANDIYPTEDRLPFIPYYRESRRTKGLVQFTVNDLAHPFDQKTALYRTGIAVGDYPIDHHHAAFPNAHKLPDLHFYPVPSYSLPLGTLIPKNTDNFIVAEKSISVTNLVNGTTRLQPVCLLIGQAAGALAAISVKNKITPEKVSVRKVQQELLNARAYLMPYSDVSINNQSFKAIQRIGATGILKGEGKYIGWENHTHFYPDSILTATALTDGLKGWLPPEKLNFDTEEITFEIALEIIEQLARKHKIATPKKLNKKAQNILDNNNLNIPRSDEPISREVFSLLIDEIINPFELKDVNHLGNYIDN